MSGDYLKEKDFFDFYFYFILLYYIYHAINFIKNTNKNLYL